MVEKRLYFNTNDRLYSMDVTSILEVIKPDTFSWLPNVPEYIIGLMNIRGYIIPVVDSGLLFGFEKRELTENSRIIILELQFDAENDRIGILVDSVIGIKKIDKKEFKSREHLVGRDLHHSISGISYSENKKSVMHIDVDQLFIDEEI